MNVIDKQKLLRVDHRKLARRLEQVLRVEVDHPVEVNLVLTDDVEIAGLNWKFLRHKGPTDVISFPGSDPAVPGEMPLLGEVVVSVQTAMEQGPRHGLPPRRELLLYAVHGILHLTGWDDIDSVDRRRMRRRESQMVDLLENPPVPRRGKRKTR